jgi:hypothetical protein
MGFNQSVTAGFGGMTESQNVEIQYIDLEIGVDYDRVLISVQIGTGLFHESTGSNFRRARS